MHGIKIIWKILTFNYRNGSWLTAIIFYLSKKPDRICRKHWSPNRYEIELQLLAFSFKFTFEPRWIGPS